MSDKITAKNIRAQFRKETGKNAIIKTLRETAYRSGYPKKTTIESYNPDYTLWLENFLVKNVN